jgi:hypothetical protein
MENTGKYYTMFLGLLVLITALTISGIAIYYSVAGLVAIFAAAAVPIMIMGGALEIGKLVTAVWLHRYWKQAAWWLKSYLAVAVVVLMLITSMGIFGFLSKAHIEQTSASEESIAKIESIETETVRLQKIIARAENKIVTLESSGTGSDTNIQNQIDTEQTRIDNAYTRIQPAIAEQNVIIANVTALFQSELDKIDAELDKLQSYIDAGDIPKAQGMIGAKADGAYGPKTAQAFTDFQDAKKAERSEWIQKLQDAAQSPTVMAARAEITRLRSGAEQQIANSNTLINRLRKQLGNDDNAQEVQTAIDEQEERVRIASNEIELLNDNRIELESEYRKLEAEVGPIKYIAEFVYGEKADKNLLEEAVRWVIITIIFVFDPLAVLLLIASQYTFEWRRTPKDDDGERLRREYEQARAQKIVDNVPPDNDPVETPQEEETEYQDVDQETLDKEFDDEFGDIEELQKESVDQTRVWQEMYGEVETVQEALESDDPTEIVEKKNESLEESRKLTREELDALDDDLDWKQAKQQWKVDNPDDSIKTYKDWYLSGKIDSLPWENYLPKKKRPYLMKENGQQKKGTAVE